MKTYQIIKRNYTEVLDNGEVNIKKGYFIAQGCMADNHLAYTRLDSNYNEIEDEVCAYIQIRDNGKLLMSRI